MSPTHRYTVAIAGDPEVEAAHLSAAGALGVWERPDDLVAWFDAPRDLGTGGSWEVEDDRDWNAEWKASLTAVHVGPLTIVPSWLADTHTDDAIVIDPGMAFGTGHHATTVMCIEALIRTVTPGTTVLDVGTGSGILAIAAARLGAARVVAVDIDPDAVAVATANARDNRVTIDVRLGAGPVDGPADVVVANLSTATLVNAAPALCGALARGGALIASGTAVEHAAEVVAALGSAGIEANVADTRDGWALVSGTRP